MNEKPICSRKLAAKTRRYFFDLYEGITGKRLTIKESRLVGGQPTAQLVTIFEEDFTGFAQEFLKILELEGFWVVKPETQEERDLLEKITHTHGEQVPAGASEA